MGQGAVAVAGAEAVVGVGGNASGGRKRGRPGRHGFGVRGSVGGRAAAAGGGRTGVEREPLRWVDASRPCVDHGPAARAQQVRHPAGEEGRGQKVGLGGRQGRAVAIHGEQVAHDVL